MISPEQVKIVQEPISARRFFFQTLMAGIKVNMFTSYELERIF